MGPISPLLMMSFSPFQHSAPTGETTAAVPVPKASLRRPAWAASKTS